VPCDVFPPAHGGATRARYTVKYLSEENLTNVLLSYAYSLNGKTDLISPNLKIWYCPKTALDKFGYRSVLFNPFYFKQAYRLMKSFESDIIHCELLWSAFSGISLKRSFGKPLVLIDHNIEYLKFREMNKPHYSCLLREIEKTCCDRADKIVVVSEVDKKHMMEIYGIREEKIAIIPNCADTDEFKYSEEGRTYIRDMYSLAPEAITLMFVGKMDYAPNLAAVKYIVEKIYPIIVEKYPKSKFIMVGKGYERLLRYKRRNMILPGFVNRLPDYLSAADIVIIPLDSGSGTRLKILEAASCSRPIVSTKKGVEGLNFLNNKEIVVTEGINEEFIESIIKLIEDEGLRRRMGNNARKKVESRYSWKEEIKKFEKIYEELES